MRRPRRPAHLAPRPPRRRRYHVPAMVALLLAALLAPLFVRTERVQPTGAAGACDSWRLVVGDIPLSWTWQQAHAGGQDGITTKVAAGPASLACARLHNVEDGWNPREHPYPTNKGFMDAHDLYMTGIRDDAIEDDNFMPGTIRDSLFDGVHTFLSEQNQRNGGTWQGATVGSGEDPTIHLTRVYVRLYATNPDRGPGRWFKWQPRGLQPHRLEITDSVFAIGATPASWKIPQATWRGTNFILWLAEGNYPGPRPAGVTVLEGAPAQATWAQIRNTWLATHGFSRRPAGDLDPMNDPVAVPSG
jgi:hypothetical protein